MNAVLDIFASDEALGERHLFMHQGRELKHTILLVDNEENILRSLTRLFRQEGYDVITAISGEEGLEVIKKHDVSLVIADHRMPGMDGVEFLSKVKEISPDTIRILLTGHTDTSTLDAINRGYISKYLTKPWNSDKIKFTVRDAIERYTLIKENREQLLKTKKQMNKLYALTRNLRVV